MSSPGWEQVKNLFQQALELEPQRRADFLAQACAGDAATRSEVESLLASHQQAGDFIEEPAGRVVAEISDGDQTKTAAEPRVGEATAEQVARLIPDYELVQVCGEGAFGKVWIVQDRVGAYRAMKVIELDRLASHGVSQRELNALGMFCRNVPTHANLVQVFHIGQTGSQLYYTMELADNLVSRRPIRKKIPTEYRPMTLSGVLESGRLNTDTAVEIVLRLLNGLGCLHSRGLVHRDIKPANIIFVNREIKLADVSLVAISRSQMSMVGTPRYMPPDDRMDATADTYALGKVLYEMITGCDLSSFPYLPPTVSSTKLDVGKLDDFVSRACASSAKDRFADADEMRECLLACRFPLHDSPLLELADSEVAGGLDDSGAEMVELKKAVSSWKDKSKTSGSANSTISGRQKMARYTLRTPKTSEELVWAVVDRLISILPWVVVLILGLVLMMKLM